MVIAVQRPEPFGVANAVRPIVEEGIGIEINHHLQRQRQEAGADCDAGMGGEPGADPIARNDRQAQHHQPADLAHHVRLVQQPAGDIGAKGGGARKEQRMTGTVFPAHQHDFQPQHGRQDHQQQQGIAEQLAMNVVHGDGMVQQMGGKLVGQDAQRQQSGTAKQGDIGEKARHDGRALPSGRPMRGPPRGGGLSRFRKRIEVNAETGTLGGVDMFHCATLVLGHEHPFRLCASAVPAPRFLAN